MKSNLKLQYRKYYLKVLYKDTDFDVWDFLVEPSFYYGYNILNLGKRLHKKYLEDFQITQSSQKRWQDHFEIRNKNILHFRTNFTELKSHYVFKIREN